METNKPLGLLGAAAPGPDFLGGQGVAPDWGLGVEGCCGSFEGRNPRSFHAYGQCCLPNWQFGLINDGLVHI